MISMTKNYLEELRFPISKEEKQVLAKMYGDLSYQCTKLNHCLKERRVEEINSREICFLILEANKGIMTNETVPENQSYILDCIRRNASRLQEIPKDYLLVFRVLGFSFLETVLSESSPSKHLSQCIAILKQSQGLLKEQFFNQLLLGLVSLSEEMEISDREDVPYNLFPSLVDHLGIIEKNFKNMKSQFLIMRNLLRLAISCMMFNGSSGQPKKFYKYYFQDEKFLIEKPNNPSIKLEHEGQFLELLEKYAVVDPEFHLHLLREVEKWAEWQSLDSNLEKLFSVVIWILEKKVFDRYEESVFKMLLSLSSDKSKSKIIHLLLAKMITKLGEEFCLKNKEFIFNLARTPEIKRLLLDYYYQIMKKKQKKDKNTFNHIVRWNLELNRIKTSEFVHEFFSKDIANLNFPTQIEIFLSESGIAIELIDTLLEQKKILMDQSNQFQAIFNDSFLKNNYYTYISFSEFFLECITGRKSMNEIFQDGYVRLTYRCMRQIKLWVLQTVRKAVTYQIMHVDFYQNIVLLLSLLEGEEDVKNVEFFIELFHEAGYTEIFIEWLQKLFYFTKNKFPLKLILSLYLVRHLEDRSQSEQIIPVLQKVVAFVEGNKYAKFMSFDSLNLKICLAICCYSGLEVKQLMRRLIICWFPLFRAHEVDLVLYQFNKENYTQLLSILKLTHPQEKIKKSLIISQTVELFITLLKGKRQPKISYFNPYDNCICLMPVRETQQKPRIELKFNYILNMKFNTGILVEIHSKHNKYYITFSSGNVCIKNQEQKTLRKQKDIKEEGTIAIKIHHNYLIALADEKRMSIEYPEKVDCIKVKMIAGIVYGLSWKCNFDESIVEKSMNDPFEPINDWNNIDRPENYHVFDQIQIKVKKATPCQFSAEGKMDFEYIYLIMIELLKYCGKECNCNFMFNQTIELAKIQLQKQKRVSVLVQDIFNCILKQNGKGPIKMPEIQIVEFNKDTIRELSCLLQGSVFHPKFFEQAEKEDKEKIIVFAQTLLLRNRKFCQEVENQTLEYFYSLVDSCFNTFVYGENREFQTKLVEIIHALLIRHAINENLYHKFGYYFYKSKENQEMKAHFNRFLEIVSRFLVEEKDEENFQQKVLAQYLVEYSNLQYIFLIAEQDFKIKVLDYFSKDKMDRFTELLDSLPTDELEDLMDLIFVMVKQYIFFICDLNKETQYNIKMAVYFFEMIIKCDSLIKEEKIKEGFLDLTIKFISHIRKKQTKKNEDVPKEFQEFACDKYFVLMIEECIVNLEEKGGNTLSAKIFLQTAFEMIFHMPKPTLMKALKHLRNSDDANLIAKYILQLNFLLTIPLYAMNALFQFLIEAIHRVRTKIQEKSIHSFASLIRKFITRFLKEYKCEVKKPFLYAFPRLERREYLNDREAVQKKIREMKNCGIYELKGGIYLKIIVITFHLVEMQPQQNYSWEFQLLLDKIFDKNKRTEAASRAVGDFIQISKDAKDRTPIGQAMKEVEIQHMEYYEEEDCLPGTQGLVTSSRKGVVDLTSFYIDYFFMRLCNFLQSNVSSEELGSKYSEIFIHYIRHFRHIMEEMSDRNVDNWIKIEVVDDLKKYDQQKSFQTVGDEANSIHSGRSRRSQHEIQQQFPELVPKIKKKSTIFESYGKKRDIIAKIQKNRQCWWTECKSIRFHRYFRQEAKQILMMEVFHEFYTNFSASSTTQLNIINNCKKLGIFNQIFEEFLEDRPRVKHPKNKGRVKEIEGFTSGKFKPLVQIKTRRIGNMAAPWVKKTKQSKYALRAFNKLEESLNLNQQDKKSSVSQEFFREGSEEDLVIRVVVDEESEEEEVENFCEISNRKGVFFCEWKFEDKGAKFTSKKEKIREGNYIYGSLDINIIKQDGKVFELDPEEITEIFFRKFNQIKHNSLQFFLKNGKSLYVILYTEKQARRFLSSFIKAYSVLKGAKVVDRYTDQFQKKKFTDKWVNGEMSNFDYLMAINKYSGRSFNEINQYFVFPWVLKDYTSSSLDLRNPEIFRDLSKPIGALNPAKFRKYEENWREASSSEEKFLYGSHYSTSLFLMYYLVRIEPFSTLHRQFQSGHFDCPDRLFSSLEQMWDCLMSESNTSDVKESIPEFYYFPPFLKNLNGFNFGEKTLGARVNDVSLPGWAKSAEDFIFKMRAALESDYVSANLHLWIDLIFGRDQESLEKKNIFHPCSYHKKVSFENCNVSNADGFISQLTFFGQNPYQLFQKEHPPKKKMAERQKQAKQEVEIPLKECIKKITRGSKSEDVVLEIANLRSEVVESACFSMESPASLIKKSISNRRQMEKGKSGSQMLAEPELKLYCENGRVTLKNDNVQLHSFIVPGFFSKALMNETVFVVYGASTLRVYDWTNNLIFQHCQETEEVSFAYLEPLLLFYGTSRGKVLVYDLVRASLTQVHKFEKPTVKMDVVVTPMRKLITHRNESLYKILMIGDQRKVAILEYRHRTERIK